MLFIRMVYLIELMASMEGESEAMAADVNELLKELEDVKHQQWKLEDREKNIRQRLLILLNPFTWIPFNLVIFQSAM